MESYREPPQRPLVVAFGKGIRGLSTINGAVIWEHEPGGNGRWTVLVTETCVYALGQELFCLDYASGALRWRAETPEIAAPAAMVLEADRLYLGDGGVVLCFNLEGRLLWQNRFKGKGMSPVALGFPRNVAQADYLD